jgi:hypothetical protein
MYRPLIMLSLLATLVQPACAAPWTAAEIGAMPPYCAARFAREENNIQEYKRWEAQYGPDFLHVHHLCHGIGWLESKYPKARTQQDKRYALDRVFGELGYMLNHAKPDFGLMPDVHLYRGIAFIYQKNDGDALKEFLKALELNPKFSPAYGRAADLYIKLGSKDQALKIVTEGLLHLPSNKGLQRQYEQLGGKLPYPEPIGDKEKNVVTGHPNEGAAAGSGPSKSATSPTAKDVQSERNSVTYSFSRVGNGGMKHGYNAGNYVFLEVTEDPKAPSERVLFRITTTIPQPHSRIQSIAFGLGGYTNLFVRLEPDSGLGQYYPVTHYPAPYVHPFWPKFKANYVLEFTMDPKQRKYNDPRRMSPGNSLVIKAVLGPGVRYEDVVEALKSGTQQEDGLIVAIIPHHLAGPPLPGGTRSDDGGYFTGSLLAESGPHVKGQLADLAPEKSAVEAKSEAKGSADDATVKHVDAPLPPAQPFEPGNNPRNPWCRFCPTTE